MVDSAIVTALTVNCMNCRYFDATTMLTCTAFPEGIPVPVMAGDILHDQPIVGDHGISFAPSLQGRLDQDGIACGKGYIAASKKCRTGTSAAVKASGKYAGAIGATAGLGAGLALGAGVTALALYNLPIDTTQAKDQTYSDDFPSKQAFEKAKLEPVTLAKSFDQGGGFHSFGKIKVGNREFFAKQTPELAIAKEVSSFEVAKAVGLDRSVLPMARTYFGGKPYVVSPLLNQSDIRQIGQVSELTKAVKALPKETTGDFLAFDYAIDNHDRHPGNLLVRKDKSLLLIDHGDFSRDIPILVSPKLDTMKNLFYKHGFGSNANARIPAASLQKFVSQREQIRTIVAHRYAGQPSHFVNPILKNLDRRFDVMESMLNSGDLRIKHMVAGEPVKTNKDGRFDGKSGVRCGEGWIAQGKECRKGQSLSSNVSELRQPPPKIRKSLRTASIALGVLTIAAAGVGLAMASGGGSGGKPKQTKQATHGADDKDWKRQAEERQQRYQKQWSEYEEAVRQAKEEAAKRHQAYQQQRSKTGTAEQDQTGTSSGEAWENQSFRDAWKQATGVDWDAWKRSQQSGTNQRGSVSETQSGKGWWDVLGVKKDASVKEIRAAYRQAARKFHPDVNKSPEADAIMKELNDAFEVSKAKDRSRGDAYWLAYTGQIDRGMGQKAEASPSMTQRDQVANALQTVKAAISIPYRDGIDQLLGQPKVTDRDVISGFFRDSAAVFSYEIAPEGYVSYKQIEPAHFDSYLVGYFLDDIASYLPEPLIAQAIKTELERFDAIKTRQCLKGTPCGSSCIAKGQVCNQQLGASQQRDVKQAGLVLRQSDLATAALGAGLIVGSAAIGGAAATGLAVSANNRQQAAHDLRLAQQERQKTEAARQAIEALASKPNPKLSITRRVGAAALEAGLTGAAVGIAGGPAAAATAGAIAAGTAVAKELAKASADKVRDGGAAAEGLSLSVASAGSAIATSLATTAVEKRKTKKLLEDKR